MIARTVLKRGSVLIPENGSRYISINLRSAYRSKNLFRISCQLVDTANTLHRWHVCLAIFVGIVNPHLPHNTLYPSHIHLAIFVGISNRQPIAKLYTVRKYISQSLWTPPNLTAICNNLCGLHVYLVVCVHTANLAHLFLYNRASFVGTALFISASLTCPLRHSR